MAPPIPILPKKAHEGSPWMQSPPPPAQPWVQGEGTSSPAAFSKELAESGWRRETSPGTVPGGQPFRARTASAGAELTLGERADQKCFPPVSSALGLEGQRQDRPTKPAHLHRAWSRLPSSRAVPQGKWDHTEPEGWTEGGHVEGHIRENGKLQRQARSQ